MIEEVDFSIPLNQIASNYWFEEEEAIGFLNLQRHQ